MLKHTGVRRTHLHNVRLAALLSLIAGAVNAEGFLGFSILTTNVTGHAALFAEKVSLRDWKTTWVIALWMLLFLGGAFISSLIIDLVGRNQRYSYLIPILLELGILVMVAIMGNYYSHRLDVRQIFAGSLLFAMGMQNALVSVISRSVVRTTHLTGTFTDLGIELAQIVTIRGEDRSMLRSGIVLKTVIILSFITGALSGAHAFRAMHFFSFYWPALMLVFALLYDVFRVNVKRYYRKIGKSLKKLDI
ncbi:YoaK family protein [Flavitalea sp. BT771]|uniref:YoaK family protein n=1 Tax=Flavitalea sp. BT771 TaxID=3063329 RepID=UPI0026E396E1|nr:YoaK family protein [Flavitalea sp. BT771]MDO6430237.1 YoaK family protein [Flavitalea sp. BT771]MDV6219623.1 YoaK family protein [Flavitalea sp. BT771]